MEKVNLPNLPDRRATDYSLVGFNPAKYARVIYQPQESRPDYIVVEVQAFEVDANGLFVAGPNGMPSRTPGTRHTIHISGVGDTHTLRPGWVRQVGEYNSSELPEGTIVGNVLPETANVGDRYYVDPHLYRWDQGMLETIMRDKAQELANLIRNSADVANLL